MTDDGAGRGRAVRLAILAFAFVLTVVAGWALFAPWWPSSWLGGAGGAGGPGGASGPDGRRADARTRLPVYFSTPEFALVAQDGDTLRASDLEGTVWVASFVFTNCETVCPLISARMAELRDSLAVDGVLGKQVRLVSVSVDPARDTPPVLRRYASRFGGSTPEEWAFLTGEPPGAVRRLVEEGFKVSAAMPPGSERRQAAAPPDTAGGYQVVHAPYILLVDGAGRVRGIHQARDPELVDRLLEEIRLLARSSRG